MHSPTISNSGSGARSTVRQDPAIVRWGLTFLALATIGILIVIPVVHVFYQALAGGLSAYFNNLFRDRDTLHAILLTLIVAPTAVVANVIRITATGLLYRWAGKELADAFFHDFAGWFMMPLAVGILWLELWFLSHLLIAPDPDSPKPVSMVKTAVFPGPMQKSDRKADRKGPRKRPPLR